MAWGSPVRCPLAMLDHPAPSPDDREQRRLRKLIELNVLDTPQEPVFDSLAQLASELCGTPIALVSLIDADRQWFKANVGLHGVQETPRDVAFCDHAIRSDTLLVVPDATADTRFADNPLVTGDPGIRFYAGAPLVMSTGERVGTLCVIDAAPRAMAPEQAAALQQLARLAVQTLEMRRDLVQRTLEARNAREEATAAGAARLRAMLDAQREMVSQAQPDGTLVYVNPAYAEHLGTTVEAVQGRSLYDFIPADEREAVRQRITQVMATGEAVTADNPIVDATGQSRWIAWTNSRQTCTTGEHFLHSTGRDVTERRRADARLAEHRALLARTEALTRTGGWSLDLVGGTLSWSEETRRLHEVADDFRPTLANALDFYTPESRPRIEAAVGRAIESGDNWDLELELVTARGHRLWARAIGQADFVEGRAVRLSGAFQDITERRLLQARVEEQARFTRKMADELPVRVAYLDADRRYRFVNAQWCRLAGLRAEDAIGRTRAELFPHLDDTLFAERARMVLAGEPVNFEYDELQDGERRRYENRLTPDIDAQGRVHGFFLAGIDITERHVARKAAEEIAAIFQASSDLVLQWQPDGQLVYANPAAAVAMQGSAERPLLGLNIAALLPADTLTLYRTEILPTLDRGTLWVGDASIDLPGRLGVPVSLMVLAHRGAGGDVSRYSAVMRDITTDVQARQEVLRQTATLSYVADTVSARLAVVSAEGRYRFVNEAFARAVGRPAADIVGRGAREVIGEQELQRRLPAIQRVLAGERARIELATERNGQTTWADIEYIPMRLPTGELDGFVAVTTDITERRREEARLHGLSQTDALTGLLNRTGFEQRVTSHLSSGEPEPMALMYIDLDRFKAVNDTHGHAAGDSVLRQVARRMVRRVRPTDTIARLGGDEFALFLPGLVDAAQLARIGRQIIEDLSGPFDIGGGQAVSIGASAGGVAGQVDRDQWAPVLDRADQLLYQAKDAGRGRCKVEALLTAVGSPAVTPVRSSSPRAKTARG